jgi:DMSO/TMAO reductase YedYZ molybdopterin-dependent catalytic subunit
MHQSCHTITFKPVVNHVFQPWPGERAKIFDLRFEGLQRPRQFAQLGETSMSDPIDRRHFLGIAAGTGLSAGLANAVVGAQGPSPGELIGDDSRKGSRDSAPFLTEANKFVDVSRGNPKPHTLKGEALAKARLTPSTWRLEIVGDPSANVARPGRLEDNTALDLAGLKELGKSHGVKFLKAMQCNNIPFPLGQGLWEGVPLRDVLRRVGKVGNVRRVYYWGFHNDDPAQLFQSSLAYNRAMESPPWEPPPLVAYRLNGQDIPLVRGGPVRMIVPWAHGFKSVKWLQRIVLTNDYQANDTYALQNNDPESYLKTAAYIGRGSLSFKAGEPVAIAGAAMVGLSGLKRVEFWLRPASGRDGKLADDDPAWLTAEWRPCELMPPPSNWKAILPKAISSKDVWGFDRKSGTPKDWPLLYSMVPWTARIKALSPGTYEIRARTVDLNDLAQPEPRPYQKSGLNLVPIQTLVVTA